MYETIYCKGLKNKLHKMYMLKSFNAR